jgi:GT2 family glycosyltransferase
MDLTVGIITWNSRALLKGLLDSLEGGLEGLDTEIWVVDNGSIDGTIEMLNQSYGGVNLIQNAKNLGVAPARNQILPKAAGRYLVHLDVDTLVKPGAMQAMVSVMDDHPEAAIGGPKLVYGDGNLQLSCRPFPSILNIMIEGTFLRDYFPNSRFVKDYTLEEWDHGELREVDWMYGACLMVRKDVFQKLKGFDEGFFYLYEDIDLCLRAQKMGYTSLYIPHAEVIHYLEREEKSVLHPRIIIHIRSIIRYLIKKWSIRFVFFRTGIG